MDLPKLQKVIGSKPLPATGTWPRIILSFHHLFYYYNIRSIALHNKGSGDEDKKQPEEEHANGISLKT